MRKWMRNRLKRKKSPSAADSEKPQAPLQPAYFEAEPQPLSTQVHHSREKSAEEQPRENLETQDAAVASAAVDTSPTSVAPARSPGTDEQQRRPRHRTRARRRPRDERGAGGAADADPLRPTRHKLQRQQLALICNFRNLPPQKSPAGAQLFLRLASPAPARVHGSSVTT